MIARRQRNGAAEPIRIGTIENDAKKQDFDSQQYRVYSPDGKSVTLCGQGGGVGAKRMGRGFVGCEINPSYVEMAAGRIAEVE